MASHSHQPLHIYFFPLMAPGHMIPLVDIARQFARHDSSVKVTIVLPHLDAPRFQAAVERDRQKGSDIRIRQVTFPAAQVGLPENCTSLASITQQDMYSKFDQAVVMLRGPSEVLVMEDRPDCIVSDFFLSWTAELAAELHIPRIIAHVTGFFPLCVHHSLIKHRPHDDNEILVPGLPDSVKMKRRQIADFLKVEIENPIMERAKKANMANFGTVFNTFKELEPGYAEYYKNNIGSKVWHVGPASLCNTDTVDKAERGGDGDTNKEHCLEWLSKKPPNSVIYVCFGTMSLFSAGQVNEIAMGLEACGWDFIWVIKNGENLDDGFEKRVGERGLIVKSWAPQVLILEHESVGGFVTHCGWNSLLEGVCAGKPMITWPISSEQFENEKLVTEILRIGVGVGCEEWSDRLDVGRGLIREENVRKAVNEVMAGEQSVEMKRRVVALSEQAKRAVGKGGSSYDDLDSLIGELRLIGDAKVHVV